ncbi:DMT family transporter [Brevibacillus massiliensis]|uniref:DMT family transporter n=1 Tax=Brevibacillus massiliensis TaxID=1118054 RepID=UPI000474A7D3|nr:DMT family transporter [Brevibacillus massiliensis]
MSKSMAWLFLILANVFWAGNYIFGKFVTAEVSPLGITFARWLLALFLLFPLALWIEKPDWRQVKKAWLPLAVLGLTGAIGYNITLYAALKFTTATNAALVNALNPALIVLCSAFLLRERMAKAQIGGFLLSLIGVLFILTQGSLSRLLSTDYNKGDLLMLAAISSWTLYSLLIKKLTNIPPITATAVSSLIAVFMMLPFVASSPVFIQPIGTRSVIGIVYMAVFPSVGSYLLWNFSLRTVSASQAGITLNLIPVFTALIGITIGEQVTVAQILGGLLVFAGVTLTSVSPGRWRLSRGKRSESLLR